MDTLTRLEAAIDRLIERNQQLEQENTRLSRAQEEWQQERRTLLEDIDRMLARLDQFVGEDPQ